MDELEMKSLMGEYLDHYTKTEVVFEIVKQLYNRETVFIDPFDKSKATRLMKIHSIQHWQQVTKWVGAYKRPYNIYYSLAKYRQGIPNQVFNHEQRKINNKEWNEGEHWKNIETFDFLIDFDGDDEKHCEEIKKDVLAVSNVLKEVPHSIRFSGNGFHIIVPGQFMPQGLSYNPELETNYYSLLADILSKLKKDYSGVIDLACVDSRRVVKVPYSVACYEDGCKMCWPYFKYSEINEIKISQFVPTWIFSSTSSIKNRGISLFNQEKNNKTLETIKLLLGKKWDKYKRLIS